MENIKYETFDLDNTETIQSKYVFITVTDINYVKLGKDYVLMLVMRTDIMSFSERHGKLEQFYKYCHHLLKTKKYIKICVITTHPHLCFLELYSELELFKYLYKVPFKYGTNSKCLLGISKFLSDLSKKYEIPIDLHIWGHHFDITDDIKKMFSDVQLVDFQTTTNIDFMSPNIFISSDDQTTFNICDQDMLFDNDSHTTDGIINGNDVIIIAKRVSNEICNDNIIKCSDIVELIFKLYNIYLSYSGLNNKESTKLFVNSFFSYYLKMLEKLSKITYNYIVPSYLKGVLNIIKEWNNISRSIPLTNVSEIDNFVHKMSVKHITHKKYLKMINKLSNNNDISQFKNNIDSIIEEIITETNNLDEDDIEKSLEIYHSTQSLTNWKDEIQEKSCIGILVNMHVPNHCRTGSNLDDIQFNSVTSTFMSISDYITILCSPENSKFTGNLNSENILDDPILGSGNFVLPIFINKYHWQIAKCYLPILLGLGISNNMLVHTEKMNHIYYSVLKCVTHKLFCGDDQLSSNLVNIWIVLFRTCSELSFNNRFHKGIEKHISNMLKIKTQLKCNIIFGQLLSVGFSINNLWFEMVELYLSNNLKKIITKENNTLILSEMIKNNDESLNDELDHVIQRINEHLTEIKENIITVYSGLQLIKILKEKSHGFVKFLKDIDTKSGVLSDDVEKIILDFSRKIKKADLDLTFTEIFVSNGKVNPYSNDKLKEEIVKIIFNI